MEQLFIFNGRIYLLSINDFDNSIQRKEFDIAVRFLEQIKNGLVTVLDNDIQLLIEELFPNVDLDDKGYFSDVINIDN